MTDSIYFQNFNLMMFIVILHNFIAESVFKNELSFDNFQEKKDRIYMLFNRIVVKGQIECWSGTPIVLASPEQRAA